MGTNLEGFGSPDWIMQYNKWMSWAAANAYCGSLRAGAHLVTIRSSRTYAQGANDLLSKVNKVQVCVDALFSVTAPC
jgi:hypothetical protein